MDKENRNIEAGVQASNTPNYIYAVIVGFLVLVGGLTIIFSNKWGGITDPIFIPPEEPIACTEDAKICPDGSAVGRVPPNCEFEACPELSEEITYLFKGAVFGGYSPEGYTQFATDDSMMQNLLLEVFGPIDSPSCMGTVDGSACITPDNFFDLDIDWDKSFVAAYAMEQQSSGGYYISVLGITVDKEGYIVNIEERKPGKSCITTSAITQPYVIVKIDYTEEKPTWDGFSFNTSKKLISCE